MTAAELAAYIGAAAWLPQISVWIYHLFVRPVVTIVPDRNAEVGFTSYGPIFNLRLAFAASRKDAILDGFELLLRHSDGDQHTFRWAGLNETLSEIQDSAGNRQQVVRDQVPIALKIGTQSLVEKFVRFQEPRYLETIRPTFNNLVAFFTYLKRSGDAGYVEKVLASKEFYEFLDARQKSFWWKAGRYEISLRLSSPDKFRLARSHFSFELSPIEVDQLQQNLENLRIDLENLIRSNLPDFQASPVNWNWANVVILPAAKVGHAAG